MSAQSIKQSLDNWIKDSQYYVRDLAVQLQRTHGVACENEPITAMVILPLIAQAREIEQRLTELLAVKEAK